MNSSGVTTSTENTGSSRTGLALWTAAFSARGVHAPTRDRRLQQTRLGPSDRFLERQRAGDAERDLRGVGVVVLAVGQRDADVHEREAGAGAVVHRVLDALLHGGDELGGDRSTTALVDEVKALARSRLDIDVDDAVLARATGLAHEAALHLLGGAADCLAVGDLGPADVGLDLELALHAVPADLEMQLAHAGDLGLAGLLVGGDLERRVLLGQAAERQRHLLLVGLRLGLHRHLDHRVGERDRLELDRLVGRGERVTGDYLLDA